MTPADSLQDTTMGPPSPSKGKGVDTTWRTGWWDFYPLLERPKRPIQWTSTSVIFSAHPTDAVVLGRHFSSSRQFILPSPAAIIGSPAAYEPPTNLTVSAGDNWLFAYFPGRDGDGIGCLWQRGNQIDTWSVKDSWFYPRNGGVVTASWIGSHREWTSIKGKPTRLPSRGPPMYMADPAFMMITADNYVNVVYIRNHTKMGVFTMRRSLSINGSSYESQRQVVGDNAHPLRQCIDAAIGLGYSDPLSPILVATSSRRMPPPPPPLRSQMTAPPFNSMDLSIPMSLPVSHGAIDQKAVQWDDYREETAIDVFDIRLGTDGFLLFLKVTYQCTIEVQDPLIDLKFMSLPHPCESSPPLPAKPDCPIFLAVSTLEVDDYARPPASTLSLYSAGYTVPGEPHQYAWELNKLSTRTFEDGILVHFEPFISASKPSSSLYATLLHQSGTLPPSPSNSNNLSAIGVIKVLNLPNLADSTDYGTSSVLYPSQSAGRYLPICAATSPSKRLIVVQSSPLAGAVITLHSLPKPTVQDTDADAHTLFIALLGRLSTADVLRHLCSPKLPLAQVENTLFRTIELLEMGSFPVLKDHTSSVMGIAVDIYRARSLISKDEAEVDLLTARWQTGHDICSVAGCKVALEDCKDETGYAYDAVWDMISMCKWLVHFTERLLRACVVWNSAINDPSSDTAIAPVFLHLTHPETLRNLWVSLKHVVAFKSFIKALPAGEVHTRHAQQALVDAIELSGIDFEGLILLLESSLQAVKGIDAAVFKRALASCQPQPEMRAPLAKLLEKISDSENLVNKSVLFLKPGDLLRGSGRVAQAKLKEKDVVSKGALLIGDNKELCVRCGGKRSIIPRLNLTSKWAVYEQMWDLRCICGGSWVTALH